MGRKINFTKRLGLTPSEPLRIRTNSGMKRLKQLSVCGGEKRKAPPAKNDNKQQNAQRILKKLKRGALLIVGERQIVVVGDNRVVILGNPQFKGNMQLFHLSDRRKMNAQNS